MRSPLPPSSFSLVLHAHLPFVRHPEYADPLEERWLHEAVIECYLPLLAMLDGWECDAVPARLTLSLSPTLVAMLRDPLLVQRCQYRLERLIELAESETVRTRLLPCENAAARHYRDQLHEAHRRFTTDYARDIPGAFARHARAGRIELITCNATHAFLPIFQHQPSIVRAQIALAVEEHRRQFGRAPAGFWSAECGYYPGLDRLLREQNIDFSFVDAHALTALPTPPPALHYAPVRTPAGLCEFARDPATARQVWDARIGYPGDPVYREFYRDAGFDLEYDYVRPYIHESGRRIATGIKYHRVTGPVALGDKEPYDVDAALARADEHARDFALRLATHGAEARRALAGALDRPPLIVAPYDAELFGHWWYEGPVFLDRLMRRLDEQPGAVESITPTEYLQRHPDAVQLEPAFSSWGEEGYAAAWLGPETQWLYPLLHDAGDRMIALARRHARKARPQQRRALNQMARELMLALSSDWAFMMRHGRMVDYATQRTRRHLDNFHALERQLTSGRINPETLATLESRHDLFPDLQFEVFSAAA